MVIPRVRVPKQFLGDFDIDAASPEQVAHTVTEGMPADILLNPKLLKC
jgi:hypothetical protein